MKFETKVLHKILSVISAIFSYLCIMQNIPFHIAYLLTRHECVIVPDLGAFVVSPSGKEKTKRWGILSPPEVFLGFNSEIKHNDGLLANSVAKEKKCSYKEANLLIDRYVTDVLQTLNEGKQVHIPWVGSLHSKENKKLFQQERVLSCNALNYGLASFSMPYAENIQSKEDISSEEKDKEIVWIPVSRKFITYTGSIAAALIAMCIIPTPLANGHFSPARTQYASLVHFSAQNIDGKTTNFSQETKVGEQIAMPAAIPDTVSKEVSSQKTNTPHYYIVVASLPDKSSANKTLTEFQSKGFENSAILSADGRHRIYTNCFTDKAEAEKYLLQFRKAHPEQADAWLLKQKFR